MNQSRWDFGKTESSTQFEQAMITILKQLEKDGSMRKRRKKRKGRGPDDEFSLLLQDAALALTDPASSNELPAFWGIA